MVIYGTRNWELAKAKPLCALINTHTTMRSEIIRLILSDRVERQLDRYLIAGFESHDNSESRITVR